MKYLILLAFITQVAPANCQTDSTYPQRKTFGDSICSDSVEYWKTVGLDEVVIVGKKKIIDHKPDGIVYITKNDLYAKGMNGVEVLKRVPRISVNNEKIEVSGKSSIRYILDGRLLETSDEATMMKLRGLQADNIESIMLLTTPPTKYSTSDNVAFVSIKLKRDEGLGASGYVFSNTLFREDMGQYLGGGLRQTTKTIDYSVDANFNYNKGTNDIYRQYTFADFEKISSRRNRFTDKSLNLNSIIKYRPSNNMETGVIFNFYTDRLKSNLEDVTLVEEVVSQSSSHSPAKPDNATNVTAYYDWTIDTIGKKLSLTYNYFDRRSKSFSTITTTENAENSYMTNFGNNNYRINSFKLDGIIPISPFTLETGASYTGIDNRSFVNIEESVNDGQSQSAVEKNTFNYTEDTGAAYISFSGNINTQLYAKLGLRYEYTSVKGNQIENDVRNSSSYGHLFPTLNVSYEFSNGDFLSASYNMGISRPRFSDLNPFRYYTTTTDYVSGNAFLNASTTHNVEINFSHKGLYAVAYDSYVKDGIGYLTKFNSDMSQYTMPENCFNFNKVGVYVTYSIDLTSWWNCIVGGELFYAKSVANTENDIFRGSNGWSGKLECNSSFMLNKKKSLSFNIEYQHLFPHEEDAIKYSTIALFNANLRYQLFSGRLQMQLSINDPFRQNIVKSTKMYNSYEEFVRNDAHSRNVSFKLTYNFGGKKVKSVYKDNKDTESSRGF
jgi:hypothetical protein